ncbi:galectin-related protein-like [Notothenia coriiceps]|uniref:Galectin-related protein-like n=1 Tax=Notothenia coriiceps TaxID=8208 RepID=A0A6I9N8K2_9TELE|nr:PREDICTED: galectin-related protein-like [Notothenia coriiceps]
MADTRRRVTEPGRKKWVVPQRSPPDENKPSVRPPEKEAERSLAVPFRGHITGGMSPGKKVVMVGVVDSRPDRYKLI